MPSKKTIWRSAGLATALIIVGTGTVQASYGGQQVPDTGSSKAAPDVVAPTVKGVQIYKCTQQDDGSLRFTQHDVAADLGRGIHHSFVRPDSGMPQWVAPDGSAVTGKKVSEKPAGAGNIPTLELKATQSGKPNGLLSKTTKILRTKTRGGVAPRGACKPESTIEVPYQAEYRFLSE
jgi:hypothetical protein